MDDKWELVTRMRLRNKPYHVSFQGILGGLIRDADIKKRYKREITVFILLSVNYLMSFLLYTSISTTIINQQRTIMLVYIFNTCFFLFWCLFSSLDVFNRQVFIYSNLILAGAKFVYILSISKTSSTPPTRAGSKLTSLSKNSIRRAQARSKLSATNYDIIFKFKISIQQFLWFNG